MSRRSSNVLPMKNICGLKTLGELEHAILQVLWRREANGEPGTTIKEVFMEIYAGREYLAYTTIATVCRRLEVKGWLKHSKPDGQYYRYHTTRSRQEVGEEILKWTVQEFFDGDPAKYAMAEEGSDSARKLVVVAED